jgi:hypothetical protein
MRNLRGVVLLAGGLFIVGALPSEAQTATTAFDERRAEAQRGKTVYVTDHSGITVKGRLVKISPQSVELLVHDGSHEWPASDVVRITERRRHAGRGALAGLAIGATFGAILFIADSPCGGRSYTGCAGENAEWILVLAGLFGGIGGGAGAAVGAVTRTERLLYVGPPGPTSHLLGPIAAPGLIGVRAQLRF